MSSQTVSVIIPAYNAEETIKQCIDGLLKQTYKKIEIIVIDDGSTENTAKIAATLKCKLIKLNKNIGYVNVLNVGLKSAKGKLCRKIRRFDQFCLHRRRLVTRQRLSG